MGVALVVLTPMLYTDTNEAWKLTSRRHRIAIGIAGIAAELLLALAAIWVWFLLPEGPVRGGDFHPRHDDLGDDGCPQRDSLYAL